MLVTGKTFVVWWTGSLLWGAMLCVVLSSCATTPATTPASTSDQSRHDSRVWGSKATLLPSWHRIGRAAAKAARDPQTWAPAMGALLFSATDWDKDVSDWAQKHHPVFGSQGAALRASDDLRDGAKYGAVVTALLTPYGRDRSAAVTGKLKGMGLQLGAYFATESVTTVFKRGVARRRPNEANNRSFPSGHTSAAFAAGTLARRNVAASGFSDMTSSMLDVGFISLGVGISWARVEGGMHYPSDVFAGAALGYFIAAVVNDAFVGEHFNGEHRSGVPRVSLQTGRSLVNIDLNWSLY